MNAKQILNRLLPLNKTMDKMEESEPDLGGSSIKEFIEGRLEEINNLKDVVRDSVQTGSMKNLEQGSSIVSISQQSQVRPVKS